MVQHRNTFMVLSDAVGEPFGSAEEAWFWSVQAQDAKAAAGGKPAKPVTKATDASAKGEAKPAAGKKPLTASKVAAAAKAGEVPAKPKRAPRKKAGTAAQG